MSGLPMEKHGAQARLFWMSWLTVSLSFSYLRMRTHHPLNHNNFNLTFMKAILFEKGNYYKPMLPAISCQLIKITRHVQDVTGLQKSSVADPDPNPEPHVFGPPGSGSTGQRYGSGSRLFYHHAKIVRKTLIPTILWFFLTFYLWKMM